MTMTTPIARPLRPARLMRASSHLALAVGLAVASAAAVGMAPAPAVAQEAARRVYDLPAGDLDAALRRFAEQSRLQLVYPSALTRGRRTQGVRGELTPAQGVAQLLAGTGLTYSFSDPRTVLIQPIQIGAADDGRVLGPVRVEGAQSDYAGPPVRGEGVAQLGGVRGGQSEEARGYRPVVASIGAGAPTALEDIPRSITVLTQSQIEKQNIDNVGEALKRLPGVTMIESATPVFGAEIVSRGFAIENLQIDGGAPRMLSLSILGNGLLDLSAYERVELIRGPNGSFLGDGSPGGMLNLVRKRPGAEEALRVKTTLGSWKRAEVEIDYSTPSLLGTNLALRTVASLRRQDFFYDNADRQQGAFYGVLDAPLGDKARVEGGFKYTALHENGAYHGFPRYVDGPLVELPRSFNIVPPWTYNDAETSEWFSRFYIDLLDDWNFEFGATFTTVNQAGVQFTPNIFLYSVTGAPFPGLGGYPPSAREWSVRDTDMFGIDFRLTGGFDTGPIRHTVLVTGDLNEYTGHSAYHERNSTNLDPYTFDSLADLNPSRYPYPVFEKYSPYGGFNYSNSNTGITLADTLSWRDKVDLNLIVRRYDRESSGIQVQTDRNTGAVTSISLPESSSGDTQPKDQWRPSWSVVVKPMKGLSLYGSRSDGSTDQSTRYTVAAKQLEPSTYENEELGLKYGSEAWLLSLSAYRLQRTNVAVSIPGSTGLCPPAPTSLCYETSGATIKSKGVDVELTGRLFEGLRAIASYNWNDEKTISTNLPSYTLAPSRMGRVFFDWTPWFNERLSIDFGASYRAKVYQAGTASIIQSLTPLNIVYVPYEFSEPSYVAFDLGFSYRLSDSLDLRLYVENLTDKEYSSTVGTSYDIRATPRSVLFTLAWTDRGRAVSTTGRAPFGDPADWYGGFDAGYHALADLNGVAAGKKADGTPAAWAFEAEGGPAFSVLLGYRFAPAWRAEVEGSFRRSDFGRIAGGGTAPTGVCGASRSGNGLPFNCDDAQGDADNWSFMANLIRDVGPVDWRLRPFVGGGLGLSRSSIDFSGKLKGIGSDDVLTYCTRYTTGGRCSGTSIPGSVWIGGDTQTMQLAWQALVGVSLKVSDRLSLDATYRYYAVPELTWGSWNYPGVLSYNPPNSPFAPRLGEFSGEYQDQSLTLGLRWVFGDR
jgi:outer membrane receptor for ferric coprogen and ferric-rhodotorulic acid